MNILVLGCGHIGSRHIQSLAGSKNELRLFAVDHSDISLAKTQEIFNNVVPKNKETKLIVLKDLTKIKDHIDIAIIASNSRERSKLIDSTLFHLDPKHIILEKVLFDKISDFKKYEKIFKKIKTKVWVNQYMGYEFSFFSKYVNPKNKFIMKVRGNWGLCCNSVHFIEIFHHLCGRLDLNLIDSSIGDKYHKSKREGYYELFGTVKITSSKFHELILECNPNVPENIINIDFKTELNELKDEWVDEHHNCNIKVGQKSFKERHYSRRQSERTLEIVDSLKSTNNCNLPLYHYSSYQHLLILNLFKNKFYELGIDTNKGIPIT